MFKLTPVIIALIFSASAVHGQALGIEDTGEKEGCGVNQECCSPSCTLTVNVPGCSGGTVAYTGNCEQNYNNVPNDKRGVSGCNGWTTQWVNSGGSRGVQVVNGNQFFGFWVPGCDAVTSDGGLQCVPKGGGCKTQYN